MELSLLSESTRDIVPPCAGKWFLFDSTNPRDHEAAAELCDTCPMLLECWDLLQAARLSSHSGGRPSGTWSGKLIGGDAATRADLIADEDARFTPEEAIAANRRYQKGDRDDETKAGKRVYERTRQRAARARSRAA